MNRLLFGDNLKPKRSGDAAVPLPPQWLTNQNVFPDASVDLEYLDPPAWPKPLRRGEGPPFTPKAFGVHSNANYNVLFKETSGADSQARAEQMGKLRDDLVPCRDPKGAANGCERSQFHAFTDTWEWTADVDATYHQFIDTCPNASVVGPCPERSRRMVEALKKPSSEGRLRDEAASFRLPKGDVRGHEYHQFLKPSQTRRAMSFSAQTSPMMAYLAMMAPRLVELHRVLKPTGSLYLHCDPTARQFPKLILDGK